MKTFSGACYTQYQQQNALTAAHGDKQMASLKKFTEIDPKARLNLSLKRSTRAALEQYLLFYAKAYGETAERGGWWGNC